MIFSREDFSSGGTENFPKFFVEMKTAVHAKTNTKLIMSADKNNFFKLTIGILAFPRPTVCRLNGQLYRPVVV
jgi:hypothetical protein